MTLFYQSGGSEEFTTHFLVSDEFSPPRILVFFVLDTFCMSVILFCLSFTDFILQEKPPYPCSSEKPFPLAHFKIINSVDAIVVMLKELSTILSY